MRVRSFLYSLGSTDEMASTVSTKVSGREISSQAPERWMSRRVPPFWPVVRNNLPGKFGQDLIILTLLPNIVQIMPEGGLNLCASTRRLILWV